MFRGKYKDIWSFFFKKNEHLHQKVNSKLLISIGLDL